MKRKISFERDGLTLVGNLFTPENFNENGQYNAIIVEGSLTSVKEQMPELYAQRFASEGFVVLAFDLCCPIAKYSEFLSLLNLF